MGSVRTTLSLGRRKMSDQYSTSSAFRKTDVASGLGFNTCIVKKLHFNCIPNQDRESETDNRFYSPSPSSQVIQGKSCAE